MNKQETREFAAQFLERHAQSVKHIVESGLGGFDFRHYVSEMSHPDMCGTICCMEGWLPSVYPQHARWIFTDIRRLLLDDYDHEDRPYGHVLSTGEVTAGGFYPHQIGVPIDRGLWISLTIADHQSIIGEASLPANASFKSVYDLWIRTIQRIRSGELDKLLDFKRPIPSDIDKFLEVAIQPSQPDEAASTLADRAHDLTQSAPEAEPATLQMWEN